MSAYRRHSDETYKEILVKFRNSIKKEFDSETIYNEKYLKTKIKSYKGKANNRIPR